MKFSFGRKTKASEPKAEAPAKKVKERSGVGVLFLLVFIFVGAAGGQYVYTKTGIERFDEMIKTDQARILEIQNTRLQLKFYEDQRGKIERNHQIYAATKNGPSKREEFAPFPEYGFETFEMKRIQIAKQGGVALSSSKTEFQRIALALSIVEGKYPLLQVSRLKMALPEDVPPLRDEPTYLDSEIEIYTPKL